MAAEPLKGLPHTQWLLANWDTLVKANIPAMKIVDKLVSLGVYNPLDDGYQRIQAEPKPSEKVRVLLETILSKSARALNLFKEALAQICPHVCVACVEPEDALTELRSAACTNYKNLETTPFTWLKGAKPIDASTFYLNLSLVEKTVAERMISSLASSSTKEIQRQEYLYSRPAKQSLVHLDKLFARFQKPHPSQDSASTENGSFEVVPSGEPAHGGVATVASASNASAAVVSSEEDAQSCSLQSAQRVGIYGNAGVGKSSCMMKAASMYANKQLWPGARAFLLWKLRDPNVQDANSLAQLLQHLNFGLTKEKCEGLASVLLSSDGENVILALDGVDELDTQKKGFIWRLLDGSILSKACVLATSRPSSAAHAYFHKYEVNLELLGFNEKQVDKFIEQQFVDKPELASQLHRILLENPTLASLMLVPLLAVMVCQVFGLTAEKPPTTRTLLYSKLLALVVRRTVEIEEGRVSLPTDENRLALAISDVRKLKGTPKKLVSELAEVAFQAHEKGMAIFDDNFLEEKAKCSDKALHIGLLSFYSVEKGLDIVQQYSFQHLTVQEFLVAYRLVAAADLNSWKKLMRKVSVLIRSTHNHVVLQFFAGLLAERLRPHFFAILNQWLHEGYDRQNEESGSRLRVCLQCAKEACGGDVKDFPSTLKLPQLVDLQHVTAADLTQLSLALEKSQHIEWLYLNFDLVRVEPENKKVSRVQTQTRRALTRLMVALNANKSLHSLYLRGPGYSLFEENGWRLFIDFIANNSLMWLTVWRCELENTSFHLLSNALKKNTQLRGLWLWENSLSDISVRRLADDLKDINTLQWLDLQYNSHGEECRDRLQHQLKHIKTLFV